MHEGLCLCSRVIGLKHDAACAHCRDGDESGLGHALIMILDDGGDYLRRWATIHCGHHAILKHIERIFFGRNMYSVDCYYFYE